MSKFLAITRFVFGTGIIAESSISPFSPTLASRVSNFLAGNLQFHPKSFVCNVNR
ncbi:MAG: hypothetical protein V3V33_07700 [Candidatus Lokiarchaeia archaeon]